MSRHSIHLKFSNKKGIQNLLTLLTRNARNKSIIFVTRFFMFNFWTILFQMFPNKPSWPRLLWRGIFGFWWLHEQIQEDLKLLLGEQRKIRTNEREWMNEKDDFGFDFPVLQTQDIPRKGFQWTCLLQGIEKLSWNNKNSVWPSNETSSKELSHVLRNENDTPACEKCDKEKHEQYMKSIYRH